MKILMINHFPLAGSGSGTYTKNLAVHLAQNGHDVTIILPENTENYEEIPGIRLLPVFFTPETATEEEKASYTGEGPLGASMKNPLPFNFPCFTSHPRSTATFAGLTDEQLRLYTDTFRRVIKEEIETNHPDIVHGQHVWILPSLAVGLGVPLVLTAHGTDLMGIDKWPNLRSYAETAIEACSAVISISKDNCTLIEERFPDQKDKIVMMRNGYDPTVFYPEDVAREDVLSKYNIPAEDYEGKKIVCFAGKLAHFKGVDVLLNAVKLYEDKEPATITLIIGDGDEWDILHELAEKLELKSVCFLGNVNQQALRELYNIADVSLIPSRREPFGLVALEAMACGTPVIATNQGGLPDFVNVTVGDLVEPEDAEGLADSILHVLKLTEQPEAPEWRKEIADYARKNFAQDTIMKELEDVYQKAVAGQQ